jgi:hypothetical protein
MAAEIHLRLYEELNDFLTPDRRKQRFAYPLNDLRSVRDLLESLAIPENEVELVLVNGTSVDFSSPLREGDFVSLYPVFESFDIEPLVRVRKQPLRRTRFIAGSDLLPLTRCLRLLGFDAVELGSGAFDRVVREAEEEGRIVLTQNAALLRASGLSRIYLVHATGIKGQLLEVLSRFELLNAITSCTLQSVLAELPGHGENSK